jgi:RluA family pseudouridine synthase
VPKTDHIELGSGDRIPIIYEDRSVLAIDKPAGWMLVPVTWQKTDHNLMAAVLSSIEARDFWARSRNLRFLQNVHRLDAETTGILLMVRSAGAMRPFSRLFESRELDKRYLVVVEGRPRRDAWTCRLPIGRDARQVGRMRIDPREGKPAETAFRVLAEGPSRTLLEARPMTGRTHQIRIHAAEAGCPVAGDVLYGRPLPRGASPDFPIGLRAIHLAYRNPFDRRQVAIEAPSEAFMEAFGFAAPLAA